MVITQEEELRRIGIIPYAQLRALPETWLGVETSEMRGPRIFSCATAFLKVKISKLNHKIAQGKLLAMRMRATALLKAKRICCEIEQQKRAKMQVA